MAAQCSGGTGATLAAFNLGLCRLLGILFPPAPHDFAAGGPFYFATKKIGVGRSSLLRPGQAPHDYAAGGPFYFATKKIGVGRGAVATTTAAGGTVLLCRHDGAASILDFRPRLANRCSRGAILGRNRAVILDFRPRLANRCSQEAKTRAILASILNFRPRLANRCSQKVKTGAIPPS